LIQNFDVHVHTSYCDGNNTPAEMSAKAFSLGFDTLGLSGHSYTPFDSSFCMSFEETRKYISEITELKDEYKGKMDILCGIEQDYFAPLPVHKYDYRIGSVHYIEVSGERLTVDLSPEETNRIIDLYFGGDYDAFAECYFKLSGDVLRATEADIIGHFDLVSKFSEVMNYGESDRYLAAGFDAIAKLIPYGKPFEVNVGAITRGYRTSPYPSHAFLKEINRLGGKIIITGDCHSADSLGDNLSLGCEFAKSCGFKTAVKLTGNGFVEYEL